MKKRLIALLLALTMVFAMIACSSTEPAKEQPSSTSPAADEVAGAASDGVGEEVTMVLGNDTPSLAPFYGQSGGLKYSFYTFYETLGIMDQRGEDATLVIAKSMEKVGVGQYQIEIWDNVYDTAGNHITAEDVKFCYDTCGDLPVFTVFLSAYDHMDVVDTYTVMLYLKDDVMGGALGAIQGVPIISKAGYEADPDSYIKDPKGTTGYVVTDFTEGYGFSVEFVGSWHEEGQAETVTFSHNVKKIHYIYITEPSQVRMALENGDADVAYNVSSDDLDAFRSYDSFQVNEDIDNRVTQLLFNCYEGTPCEDIHLRRAIAYAINRPEINQFIYGGAAILPNAVSGVHLIDYNKDWDSQDYYLYNVESAKEELSQSSYNGETIEILMSGSATNKAIGTLIVTYLEAIGVKAEVFAVEDAVVENNAEDPSAWDLYLSPRGAEDYMVNMWKHFADQKAFGGATQNFVVDDKLQNYFETMRNAATYSVELTNEAAEYLKDQCYVYTILQAPSYCVYNSNKIASIKLNYKAYPLPNAFEYKN